MPLLSSRIFQSVLVLSLLTIGGIVFILQLRSEASVRMNVSPEDPLS